MSGEGILNSKSEFNRCRIPRLKINLEEWGVRNEEKQREKTEEVDDDLEREAEEILETKTPVKRKPEDIPKGRKAKKLRFEKLEGWGEGPGPRSTQKEALVEGSVEDTLGSDRSLVEGSRSGWKSSQGGSPSKATDLRGVSEEEHTLTEGWKHKAGREDDLKDMIVRDGGMNTLTASLRNNVMFEDDETLPESWKAPVLIDQKLVQDSSRRMDETMDSLKSRWKDTEYEMILAKLEITEKWPEGSQGIRKDVLEWIEENEMTTMVEEGEDILDGLESMLEEGGSGVNEDILKDTTEIITTIIVAV